ncbi:pyridoxamine 5'-phosphate oxidase family protein [Salinicoccus sp. HZC-1]|uniref:pyridoxamine 5'-phosphate oxidase family protein n=1 Tax=Salinicoccus sp. HZC-1 TaxID=3385497 RepID=UPI00398A6523
MSEGEKELQNKYGTQRRADAFYNNQMIDYVNPRMIEFINRQEMLFISPADGEGNCDSSFRAGAPGFVRVLDASTLMYPEYRGNGVMASLGNITENPHIGLMFIDFTEQRIGLHVNGTAGIIENDALETLGLGAGEIRALNEQENNRAERWIVIKVHEAYIHCSKHIPVLKKEQSDGARRDTEHPKKKGGDFFGVKGK